MVTINGLIALAWAAKTVIAPTELPAAEVDNLENKLIPSSLDTLSLESNISYTPEQLKGSIQKTQQILIDAVNSLPDSLYQNLDVDTMGLEDLYNEADMDFFNNVDRDTYIQGVARFLKLLNLKGVEYNVWVPTAIGIEVGYPFFLEYNPEEGEIEKSLKPGTLPPSNMALCGDYGEGQRKYVRIRRDLGVNGGYLHRTPLVQRGNLAD
jgi:hypothetical protein